jgi:pimeloyl-ACP methyl ester carboxylesterase
MNSIIPNNLLVSCNIESLSPKRGFGNYRFFLREMFSEARIRFVKTSPETFMNSFLDHTNAIEPGIYLGGNAGSDTAVFLLHPMHVGPGIFLPQLSDPAIRELCAIYLVAIPGHPNSAPWPAEREPSYPNLGRWFADIVTRLGRTRSFFVGSSIGCHVMLHASPNLEDARGYFVAATRLFLAPDYQRRIGTTPPKSAEDEARKLLAIYTCNGAFPPGDIPPDCVRSHMGIDMNVLSRWASAQNKPGNFDEGALLRRFKAEGKTVLIGLGEGDSAVNTTEHASQLEGAGLGPVTIIPGSGHYPSIERPQFFNRMLRQFLKLEQPV